MRRLLPLLCTGLVLVACNKTGPSATTGEKPAAAPSNPTVTETYTNETEGYSIRYPQGWIVQENVTLTTNDTDYTGTSIVYPADEQKSTLLDSQVHIAMGEGACPSSEGYDVVTIGNRQWTRFIWGDAAAGNKYDGMTSFTDHDGNCYTVNFYLHSCNLGPDCGPDHSKPFDKASLIPSFEAILATFEFAS